VASAASGAHQPQDDEPLAGLFIARQPVFDHLVKVQGYELTFRLSDADPGRPADADAIAPYLADGSLLDSIQAIRDDRSAFLTVTRELLLGEAVRSLPPSRTVFQLDASIAPDTEVLAGCRRLRQKGYRLALDHYLLGTERDALLPVVDLAKVDLLDSGSQDWAAIARHLSRAKVARLANRVESMDVFHKALALGYGFFQGYLFARPATVPFWDIPASKINCLRILEAVLHPELDFDVLQRMIEKEVALSYKLLRYLHSAYFGRQGCVRSMRDALLFLGENQVRNWASVVALAGMADDKPEELMSDAVIRGRFCELLAAPAGVGTRSSELFIAGMFTLLEAILGRPLTETLAGIPLADDVKAALLGSPGPMRDVIHVVVHYTSGDWDAMEPAVARLGLDRDQLPMYFRAALGACVGLPALRE
jgi:EAL and modified HD-GYP domain-containing signal transduction protein